jgi:transposase
MKVDSYRIDHLGLVAQMAEDIGLVSRVNACLGIDKDHIVSPGQAVLAMILNCLGFTTRPLYITPAYFERRHLSSLLGSGKGGASILPEHLNQHKLGRVLDSIADFDPEKLFMEVAIPAFRQQGVSVRQLHIDTTSHSLTGSYLDDDGNPLVGTLGGEVEADSYSVTVCRGYSKAHRPDLKQVVQELLVSNDGDVPLMLKVFSGNKNDTSVMQERIAILKKQLSDVKAEDLMPQIIVGDSKFYSEKTITNAHSDGFYWVTRVPNSVDDVGFNIEKALNARNQWTLLEKTAELSPAAGLKYQEFTVEKSGIQQSFIVVRTDASRSRAEKTVNGLVEKEALSLEAAAKRFAKKEFSCEDDLTAAWDELASKGKYHSVVKSKIIELAKHSGKGRPKAGAKASRLFKLSTWEIHVNSHTVSRDKLRRACFVLGTNATSDAMSTSEVIKAYMKEQHGVERSFRFLKDTRYFADAFFLKNPSRIAALLSIMTLSLLVYALLQRRLRLNLAGADEATVPDQKGKPTKRPTQRWVNSMFEGVDVVIVETAENRSVTLNGVNNLVQSTLVAMGPSYQNRYSESVFSS